MPEVYPPDLTELPEGFHKVSVVVNTKELDELRHRAILTAHSTYSSAIRTLLGWHETPYGLRAALRRMRHP